MKNCWHAKIEELQLQHKVTVRKVVVASVQARAAALSSQVQFTKVTLTPAASLSIENPPPVLCCYCCILLTTVPRVLGCLDFKIVEF